MKMVLTRLGEGARMVVTGHPSQIELLNTRDSVLRHALRILEDVKGVGVQAFKAGDVVRQAMVERIVRAYDHEGRYVVVSDEDMKAAAAEKTGTISVQEFIPEEEVPGKYFEKPYYLAPEKSGARAYVLLRDALKKSKKVAVASFVMRTKEHPGLLVPDGDVLILNQLRFAEEVRDPKDLDIPSNIKIPPAELKLALSLIEQGSGEFDITRYKDTYSAQLKKMIQAKAKGKELPVKEMKVVHTKSEDLMEQLKASLNTRKKKAS